MAHLAPKDSDRMNLRIKADAKARLTRAAALRHTDLTSFVTQAALQAADAVIKEAEAVTLSERDFRRVLELLENPPKANAKLIAAAAALPKSL